jgi:cytoskeletal protein RodZ
MSAFVIKVHPEPVMDESQLPKIPLTLHSEEHESKSCSSASSSSSSSLSVPTASATSVPSDSGDVKGDADQLDMPHLMANAPTLTHAKSSISFYSNPFNRKKKVPSYHQVRVISNGIASISTHLMSC